MESLLQASWMLLVVKRPSDELGASWPGVSSEKMFPRPCESGAAAVACASVVMSCCVACTCFPPCFIMLIVARVDRGELVGLFVVGFQHVAH